MLRNGSWTRRIAVLVAFGFILAGGAAYRMAEAHLARLGRSTPLARGTLSAVPMTIGLWQGREEPLSESIVAATDTDDHLNRAYAVSGGTPVSLFIAYGVRLRDLTPHRPEVCYRGAGWSLEQTEQIRVSLSENRVLPCQVQRFSRTGLDSTQVSVLNYYIVDGEYCADVSLLRDRAADLTRQARYSVQIQIASQAVPTVADARTRVEAFASASADAIRDVIEKAVDRAAANQSNAK